MSIRLLLMEQMSGYLATWIVGVGAPDEVSQQFELIAEHCKRTKNDKLLIDTTGFEVMKFSTLDRFLAGEEAVIFARYGIKVAIVSRPELIDPRKFGTMVAQNRGVTVDVFTNFQAAEEWLLK